MRTSDAGLADNNSIRMHIHSVMLQVLDTLYSSLVVAPLVVSYWRGTWNLSEVYLYPFNKIQSQVASLIIGILGHLVFTIFQGSFRSRFSPHQHRLIFYCGSRLYTSIFGIVCVNCWRGGWQLIDHYTARDIKSVLAITIVAIIALMGLKAIRNVAAPPYVIVTDHSKEYFNVPTMYKKLVRISQELVQFRKNIER